MKYKEKVKRIPLEERKWQNCALTPREVQHIRRMVGAAGTSCAHELAKYYKVTVTTIYRAIRFQSHKGLETDADHLLCPEINDPRVERIIALYCDHGITSCTKVAKKVAAEFGIPTTPLQVRNALDRYLGA